LEQWRIEYNEQRPRSALGYLTPNQFRDKTNHSRLRPAESGAEKWGAVGFEIEVHT
jgi:hypothetical protein